MATTVDDLTRFVDIFRMHKHQTASILHETVKGDRYSKAASTEGGMRAVIMEMSMNSQYLSLGTVENSSAKATQWISNWQKSAVSAAITPNNMLDSDCVLLT